MSMVHNCIILLALSASCLGQDVLTSFSNDYVTPASPLYEERKGSMVQYRHGDVLIGAMLPVHKRKGHDGCGDINEEGLQALEIINLVVDMINNDPLILPNVTIGTVMIDTCEMGRHALQGVVSSIIPLIWRRIEPTSMRPLVAGVVGGYSSEVAMETANLLQIFKVPQVSPWCKDPLLSNKQRYPYFFRTVPSDTTQITGMLQVAKMSGWNYISVVYGGSDGEEAFDEIKRLSSEFGVCIAGSFKINENPREEDYDEIISGLFSYEQAKVVIVFTKKDEAERLFSVAHGNPAARRRFLWIGSDRWAGLIPDQSHGYNEIINGAVGFSLPSRPVASLKSFLSSLPLGSHLPPKGALSSRDPWLPEYLATKRGCTLKETKGKTPKPCKPHDRVPASSIMTYASTENVADAVLSIAYSLNEYQGKVCGGEGLCTALNWTGSDQVSEEVHKILKSINFTGINGRPISFNEHQESPTSYRIKVFRSNTGEARSPWEGVGSFDDMEISLDKNFHLNNVTSMCSEPCRPGEIMATDSTVCCWHCDSCLVTEYVAKNGTSCVKCPKGEKPTATRDGCEPVVVRSTQYNDRATQAALFFASLGIAITGFFCFVLIKFGDTAIIRASNRELCVIVILGAMLCYLNSFVLAMRATDATCATMRILLSLGPTLMAVGLLVKTIRIVIVFRSTVLSDSLKTFLMPRNQIIFAGIFIIIQIFSLTIWFILSFPTFKVVYSPDFLEAFQTCKDIENLRLMIGLVYPFLLIAACTVLATLNRRIPSGFNEAKHIGFTMYVTCVIWMAFLSMFIANQSATAFKVATLSICLNLSASTVLVCMFGYKSYLVLLKPELNTLSIVLAKRGGESISEQGTLSISTQPRRISPVPYSIKMRMGAIESEC